MLGLASWPSVSVLSTVQDFTGVRRRRVVCTCRRHDRLLTTLLGARRHQIARPVAPLWSAALSARRSLIHKVIARQWR